MELKHYLNNVLIDEPIGFDNLSVSFKRGEYHGISVAVSETSLEFYGKAVEIIKAAYASSIDSVVAYKVLADSKPFFSGVLDLTTYSEHTGEYHTISCKVGEIGARTTFNNRSETEVDLNTSKTIDGAAVMPIMWRTLAIPRKHLRYTNLWDNRIDVEYTKDKYDQELRLNGGSRVTSAMTSMKFARYANDEFGDVTAGEISGMVVDYRTSEPLFAMPDDFAADFGVGTKFDISGHIKLRVDFLDDAVTVPTGVSPSIHAFLLLSYSFGTSGQPAVTIFNKQANATGLAGSYVEYDFDFSQNGLAIDGRKLMMTLNLSSFQPTQTVPDLTNGRIKITMYAGSYTKMLMFDTLTGDTVKAPLVLVHDALSHIAHVISENELSVRSDWYSSQFSEWNERSGFGGGALKALTNGYKIRGLFTDEANERSMSLSFKSAIQSLSVLDCIGWGFSQEDGGTYVRVEPWKWFYKQDVLASFNDVSEVTVAADNSLAVTEVRIGYKKYVDDSAFNSIDSVHGERSMTSKIKALTSQKNLLCEFIADNYAIELTRRAAESLSPTEQFKYDENIFVFELYAYMPTSMGYAMEITNNVYSASGVERPKEQINVQLSPRRCAERWRDWLFNANGSTILKMTTGKLNTSAVFRCFYNDGRSTTVHLQDVVNGGMLPENGSIDPTTRLLKAETISFTYPLSVDLFNAIKEAPYGLIRVNGMYGWIKEMKYSYADGEATFKLIAKA